MRLAQRALRLHARECAVGADRGAGCGVRAGPGEVGEGPRVHELKTRLRRGSLRPGVPAGRPSTHLPWRLQVLRELSSPLGLWSVSPHLEMCGCMGNGGVFRNVLGWESPRELEASQVQIGRNESAQRRA